MIEDFITVKVVFETDTNFSSHANMSSFGHNKTIELKLILQT